MCREVLGPFRSGLCANETTKDGRFRPYCSLQFFEDKEVDEVVHDAAFLAARKVEAELGLFDKKKSVVKDK